MSDIHDQIPFDLDWDKAWKDSEISDTLKDYRKNPEKYKDILLDCNEDCSKDEMLEIMTHNVYVARRQLDQLKDAKTKLKNEFGIDLDNGTVDNVPEKPKPKPEEKYTLSSGESKYAISSGISLCYDTSPHYTKNIYDEQQAYASKDELKRKHDEFFEKELPKWMSFPLIKWLIVKLFG